MRLICFLVIILPIAKTHLLSELLTETQPLYGLTTLSEGLQNTTTCHGHLKTLRKEVDEDKVWAIKAMDASGRPEAGFVYGNNLWIGSHVMCQDISNTKKLEVNHKKILHPETPYDYPPYPMAFTIIYLKHNSTLQLHTRLPMEWTIQLGLCIPASCTKEEILTLAKVYFDGDFLEEKNLFHLNLEVIDAKILVENVFWILVLPKTIVLGVILCAIFMLTFAGTIYDVRRHNLEKNLVIGQHNGHLNGKSNNITVSTTELVSKSSTEDLSRPSTIGEILRCFSIYSNTKRLVSTKLPEDSISCIHGIKFMTMLWVIAGHAIYFQADYLKNVPIVFRMTEDFFIQIFSNATPCIDTYLFLSGFLATYLYYSINNPHEKMNEKRNYTAKLGEFFIMVAKRFLRLAPLYLVVILFTDVCYTYLAETSSLTSYERPDLICKKYWWRNLLFINNFFPRSELCLSWSWYVSLDLQLFAVTMFILILSTIAFKLSTVITFLFIIISIVVAAYKSYSIEYIPTLDEQFSQLDIFYYRPWMRIGPYMIGIITAYIVIIKLQKKLFLTKIKKICCWIIFSSFNLWILFGLYTHQISIEYSAMYVGISRTLWAIGLSWTLIACCTGNARAVEKFLAFKPFIILSKMTYSAFLLNPVVCNMFYLRGENSMNSSLFGLALNTSGMMLLSYCVSFFFSVLVEYPFLSLTKMIFAKLKRPRDLPVSAPQSYKTTC